MTPVNQNTKTHCLIEKSELIVLDEAGHMVLYEKPNELNK